MRIPKINVLYPEPRCFDKFDLGSSSFLRICGESGVGKTTYLNALALELKRMGKSVLYQNQSRTYPSGYTPREYADFISSGQDFHDILAAFDIDSSKDFAHMSGGEIQRVVLAECLVSRCEFVLLDETFNAIDTARIHQVIHLLGERAGRHPITYIYISHVQIEFENEKRLYLD